MNDNVNPLFVVLIHTPSNVADSTRTCLRCLAAGNPGRLLAHWMDGRRRYVVDYRLHIDRFIWCGSAKMNSILIINLQSLARGLPILFTLAVSLFMKIHWPSKTFYIWVLASYFWFIWRDSLIAIFISWLITLQRLWMIVHGIGFFHIFLWFLRFCQRHRI